MFKAAHPPLVVSELTDATSLEWRYDILDELFYPMDVDGGHQINPTYHGQPNRFMGLAL
jgi:hypothetical protein